MVFNGGVDGDRRDNATFRQLGLAFGIMMVVAALGLGAMDIGRITAGQRVSRQAAAECQAKSNRDSCQSSLASVRAAIASEDAVNLAIWQSVINAFGLAGLFLTVFYAARAWRASERSADAAHRALNDQPRLERAYLLVGQENSSRVVWQHAQGEHVTESSWAWFTLRNYGRTPAIISSVRAVAMALPLGGDPIPQDAEPVMIMQGTAVAAGEVTPQIMCGFLVSTEQWQTMSNFRVLLWGEVVYADVFGTEHRTGFCLKHISGPPNRHFVPSEHTGLNYQT